MERSIFVTFDLWVSFIASRRPWLRCWRPSLLHLCQRWWGESECIYWGRSILDNFMLVQQSIHTLHRKHIPSVIVKLDMAKAFDLVSWPFLLEMLCARRFESPWSARLALLLSMASTMVMINGSAGQTFLHARGLRQGDPCSSLWWIFSWRSSVMLRMPASSTLSRHVVYGIGCPSITTTRCCWLGQINKRRRWWPSYCVCSVWL